MQIGNNPIYPSVDFFGTPSKGITMREFYAINALSVAANYAATHWERPTIEDITSTAFKIADSMLAKSVNDSGSSEGK